MCGRYLRRSDKQRIAEAFHVASNLADLVLPPWDYNAAPTSVQPVLRADRDEGNPSHPARELTLMRWGLIPYFARDLKSFAFSTINARAETLATSPIFRGPFERRRCLIPADGFYEWKLLTPPAPSLAPNAKPAKLAKQPWAFTLASGQPFAFAGLWDRWRDPAHPDAPLESFTIITTTPNELTARVHTRMPVLLHPHDYDLWLSAHPPDAYIQALLRPYPAQAMAAHPAHPDVGNVRNNHPGLLNSA